MPLINSSSYKRPWWLPGGHAQSIFPSFFRRVAVPPGCEEQRIDTPDGDFIDLDLYRAAAGNKKLIIISHGMEGHARRKYMYGMIGAFLGAGWDALAWNYRCCGHEMNLRPRMYHCGDTDDIRSVIGHALSLGYRAIILGGFSMGGAISLNYLGRHAAELPVEILGGIVFSVPCDLTACSLRLDSGFNKIYTKNFMLTLHEKIRKKHAQMPNIYKLDGLEKVSTLKAFDDRYTAPIHGFLSAEDYWHKSSCMHVLKDIARPVLMVNAKNDPFLVGRCFPVEEARESAHLYLEMPAEGGHVGFTSGGGLYWSEQRALDFAREHFFPLAARQALDNS